MRPASADGERDAEIIAFPTRSNLVEPTLPTVDEEAVVIAIRETLNEVATLTKSPETSEVAEVPTQPKALRKAHNVSLHALAARGQSLGEIEKRLRYKELSNEVIAVEIARLSEAGLIDDEALAADLVERWGVRQGLGRQAIASKLRQRSIAPEIIEAALSVVSNQDESDRLEEVAADRARKLSGLAPAVARRRLEAFLARKGYRGSHVREVIDRVLA